MVFTQEQDAFLLMAHYRSATRKPDGSWSYSLQKCMQQFFEAFPNEQIPYDSFLTHRRRLLQRFQQRHCICKAKSTGRKTKLTAQVIKDIQTQMEHNPNTSLLELAKETGRRMKKKRCVLLLHFIFQGFLSERVIKL